MLDAVRSAIGVRIECGINLLGQFLVGKQLCRMFDELHLLDRTVSIVVHPLNDRLGFIVKAQDRTNADETTPPSPASCG